MQASAQTIARNLKPTTPTEQGPRELRIDELALVGGGLPRGGWASPVTTDPTTTTLGVEELPRGGWSA